MAITSLPLVIRVISPENYLQSDDVLHLWPGRTASGLGRGFGRLVRILASEVSGECIRPKEEKVNGCTWHVMLSQASIVPMPRGRLRPTCHVMVTVSSGWGFVGFFPAGKELN